MIPEANKAEFRAALTKIEHEYGAQAAPVTQALASLGARQSLLGDREPPEPTLAPFGMLIA